MRSSTRDIKTVDNFITDLHCLAEYWAYGELHSEMIRNCIVVGLLDNGLSEKMQLDPNLTLERAVSMARQSEAVHKQQGIVRCTSLMSGELESENMEAVNSRRDDKIKSATQNTFHLEKQLQLGNLQKVGEHKTSVPGVEKHHGTTDNSVLQRMLSAINVRKLDIIVLAVILDKFSLELLNQ